MASLSLRGVGKQYQNGFEAVRDVNVEIEDKDFVVFMGPSGCGKSTLFRVIAGMEEITSGEIELDGKVLNDLEPKDREIAMLFENYAIYQSLTVFDNLAFGLKLRGLPMEEIEARVLETAQIVDLTHLLHRKPRALSDIQQHRLAMGRVIICRPKLILMNEPFMYIESKYRPAMWAELSNLQQRLGITIAFVSNDQAEATRLATKIVIMNKGTVQQIGTAKELFRQPNSLVVAGFFGRPRMQFKDAICHVKGEEVFLETEFFEIKLPEEKAKKLIQGGYAGKSVVMGVRPIDEFEAIDEIDVNRVHVFDKETEETITN